MKKTATVKGRAALGRAGGAALRGAALLVVGASLVAPPRAARADQAADEAGALFREGTQLRKEGKTREACAKFAQSMKKSEGTGPTAALLLHVADCHEREGKLATAWAEFRQAANLYQQQHDEVSASECRRRAGEVRPRIPQLVLRVERPVSSQVVKRNGQVVDKAQLAARTPVDPGEYVITAEAPGYVPFRTAVVVASDSGEVVANVPALQPVPLPPSNEPPRPRPVSGYVIGGLGLAALGVGATFGVLALSSNKEAEDKCQTEVTCAADEATAARDRATTQAWVANVGLGVGLVGVAVGTYLLFIGPRGPSSAPSAGAQAGLTVSPQPGGLRLGVRFLPGGDRSMATLQGIGRRDATRGRGVGLSGLCALAALSGCQVVGGFDDLPLPSETTQLLNSPQWACLNGSNPAQPTGDVVEFRFEVVSGGTRQPLSDVKVRACNQLDTNCTAPVVSYTPVVEGVATVSLPDNFRGYFELVSNDFVQAVAGQTGPYVPEIVAFSQREILRGVGPNAVRRRTLMFTPAEVNALLAAVGGTYALDARPNGVLIATALDCLSQTTAGVTFDITSSGELAGPDTIRFYNNASQLPAPGSTETSEAGTFAQTSLFPGLVLLSSVVNPLNQQKLSSDQSIVIRDNWATSVYVSP